MCQGGRTGREEKGAARESLYWADGLVPEQENSTWRSSGQLLSQVLSSLSPSGHDSGLA